MISEIFSYLSRNDVKTVRLVSRETNELAHPTFRQKFMITLNSSIIKDPDEYKLICEFQKLNKCKNVKLDKIKFDTNEDFFRVNYKSFEPLYNFIQHVEHFEISKCTVGETMLFYFLDKITNLNSLTLQKCCAWYNTGELIAKLCKRVRRLAIEYHESNLLKTYDVHEMLNDPREPVLEVLNIDFKLNRLKKFFQTEDITKIFGVLQKSLKYFCIDHLTFGDKGIVSEDDLSWFNGFDWNLKLLRLQIKENINVNVFEKFTMKLSNMHHLDITCFESIDEINKNLICSNMVNLRTLRFYADTFEVAEYGVVNLTKLTNLEVGYFNMQYLVIFNQLFLQTFSIQGCLSSKLEEIKFPKESKEKLKDFTLICDDISDETILNIATNLPNLKTLALFKTTETSFPNKFMSLLIKNLQNLEELTIGNEEVNDYDGENEDDDEDDDEIENEDIIMVDDVVPEYDISSLKKLKAIDIFYVKNCPELSFFKLHKIPTIEVVEYTNAFERPVRYIYSIHIEYLLLQPLYYLKLNDYFY